MINKYETSLNNLEQLIKWHDSNGSEKNEATTRLQLIDRLFFECLDWSRDDVKLEESLGNEYTDYSFYAPRRILIVEAKREGEYFEVPIGLNTQLRSIKSLFRDNINLKNAMEQVAQYCQHRGVNIGAVCNGSQLVTFIASRGDGNSPFEGKALVFYSLQDMYDNFIHLWNALSKPALESKSLIKRLMYDIQQELPLKLSAKIIGYPGIKNRNVFQTDLQIVSDLVFEDLAKSTDIQTIFIEECYCKSGALSQYSKTSKAILSTRYAALFGNDIPSPTTVPAVGKGGQVSAELVADSLSRRPILLIGDVGVGKSTFILYLTKVDAVTLFDNAILIYIDLGSQGAIALDLRKFIIDDISLQLLNNSGVDIEEWSFVRGVYNKEIERFRKGIYRDLFETDPDKFKQKEIEFFENKLANREEHLKNSLEHISKARKKQIVVFIDNADQRNYEVQQLAFLISQEFAEHWPATVFLALRPETFNKSLKTGTLSGYHPKAYTIAPPRIDMVIKKRLQFGLKITSGQIPLSSLPESTRIQLSRLDTIIRVFIDSLEYYEDLVSFIDNISGGNVRLALELVKGFFGSGHVDTEKIFRIYNDTGTYYVPLHEFLRAVIYGDNEYYNPDSSIICNLFDISRNDPREHFLLLIMIGILVSASGTEVKDGFVETAKVYERLQGLGFVPEQIDFAIIRGGKYKLIQNSSRENPEVSGNFPQAIRVTTVGQYCITDLCTEFPYIDAMVVDTPILDIDTKNSIHDETYISKRIERAELFKAYLDRSWEPLKIQGTAFDWQEVSVKLQRNIEYIKSKIPSQE